MKIGSNIHIVHANININIIHEKPFRMQVDDLEFRESNYIHYSGDSFTILDIINSDELYALDKIYVIRHLLTGMVFKTYAVYFKEFWDIVEHGYISILGNNNDCYLAHGIRGINIRNIQSLNDRITFMICGKLIQENNGQFIFANRTAQVLFALSICNICIPDEHILDISPGYSTNNTVIFDKLGYILYAINDKKNKNLSLKVDVPYPLVEVFINENNSLVLQKYYGFLLNHKEYSANKKPIIYYKKDDKYILAKEYINIKLIDINNISQSTLNGVLNSCFKATILNVDKSIELFQNKRKKLSMFEESKNGKLFTIRGYIKDYKCKVNNQVHNIVELEHGNIALKFVDFELGLIPDNLKGITPPKDRTIEKGVECKVIRNKNLPLSLGSKVKVVKVNKLGKFVKNVVVTSDNKDNLICSIKNLKRI